MILLSKICRFCRPCPGIFLKITEYFLSIFQHQAKSLCLFSLLCHTSDPTHKDDEEEAGEVIGLQAYRPPHYDGSVFFVTILESVNVLNV